MNLIDIVNDLGNSDNENDTEDYISFLDDLIRADYLDPDDFMRHIRQYFSRRSIAKGKIQQRRWYSHNSVRSHQLLLLLSSRL